MADNSPEIKWIIRGRRPNLEVRPTVSIERIEAILGDPEPVDRVRDAILSPFEVNIVFDTEEEALRHAISLLTSDELAYQGRLDASRAVSNPLRDRLMAIMSRA